MTESLRSEDSDESRVMKVVQCHVRRVQVVVLRVSGGHLCERRLSCLNWVSHTLWTGAVFG